MSAAPTPNPQARSRAHGWPSEYQRGAQRRLEGSRAYIALMERIESNGRHRECSMPPQIDIDAVRAEGVAARDLMKEMVTPHWMA